LSGLPTITEWFVTCKLPIAPILNPAVATRNSIAAKRIDLGVIARCPRVAAFMVEGNGLSDIEVAANAGDVKRQSRAVFPYRGYNGTCSFNDLLLPQGSVASSPTRFKIAKQIVRR
jgi:hypothetical protein